MTSVDLTLTSLEHRRALEGLRNGVPNRYAVRLLGCHQPEVEERFRRQLVSCRESLKARKQARGMLIAGDFGAGKSHLLEYLKHIALGEGFVCSRVVISKETPLWDPTKVFLAAVENAVLPDRRGQAVKEMALVMQRSSSYAAFSKWVSEPHNGLSELLRATLLLHERLNNDPDLTEEITDFWSGGRLAVARVKQGLKMCGAGTAFDVRAVKARELATQRTAFLARMIVGAGYQGWVVLIDEVELVGRYSLTQRGRSYAELAQWLGHLEDPGYPGVVGVAAITGDFSINVLKERGDLLLVAEKLRQRPIEDAGVLAARAEAGMNLIARHALELQPPSDVVLEETYLALRKVHGMAYQWDPPEVEGPSVATRRAMRSYLRWWINQWDLRRIYPVTDLETIEEQIGPTYSEEEALEAAADDDGAITDL